MYGVWPLMYELSTGHYEQHFVFSKSNEGGGNCTKPCSLAYLRKTKLTGAVPALMAHRCPPGGQETDPNPTDRGKLGSKRHIIVDAQGIPLTVLVSGANRHYSKIFEPRVDVIPAVKGLQGRPPRRPYKLHADKGYDYPRCRTHLKKRGILSRIARRGV